MGIDKKFKNLHLKIKDPKLRLKLEKLMIEREKLIEKREMIRKEEIKKQEEMHNKYLPKYLSPKILNAIGFIEYTKEKGELDMLGMTRFLMEEKKLSSKEIEWVFLLSSFESIEEILTTPEISGMIKNAIQKSRGTIH